MFRPRGPSKTIILKSPDTENVREVIVTSVLLPKSENENNMTSINTSLSRNCTNASSIGHMEGKRVFKRRLDHLSLEEKIMRKKLKNREAAQTSRDKKKARLEELEVSITQLHSENDALHEEIRSLREEKECLQCENSRLTEEVWRLSVAGGASGPAVSCPLPQGARPPPAQASRLLSTRLRLLLIINSLLSLSTTGTGSTAGKIQSPLSLKILSSLRILSLLKPKIHKWQKHRKKVWWGRRQRTWNPVGQP